MNLNQLITFDFDVLPQIFELWGDWENEFEKLPQVTGRPLLKQIQSGAGRKRLAEDEEDISSTKRSRHVCEICGKVFTRPDKLKRHEKIHINEKPRQCNKCDKSFHRNLDLKRHEKQVHERRAAQREYVCNTCGEVFHNLAPFRAHQKTAHSKPSTTAKRPQQDDSERKTKKTKSTPIEKKQSTPSSSWQQEPRSITDLPEAQQSLVPEYRNLWHQIRTRFSRKNRLLD